MKRRGLLLGGTTLLAARALGSVASNNASNFFVPAEEAPHQRTLMQWPVNRLVYPDPSFLRQLQDTIARIANTISAFEPVAMLAAGAYHKSMRKRLAGAVELWDIPTDDLWCRDSGPLFAKAPDGSLRVSHLSFNGWGNKQVHEFDGRIAEDVAARLSVPLIRSGLVGEAGGVEHDGSGLLLAHESSWVNDNRNPGMARQEIEARLLRAYGAKRILWSPGVWGQDITDYHIDSLARCTGAGRVLLNLPQRPDQRDPFHVAALETYRRLIAADLDIEVIHEPAEVRSATPQFVASYVNYYVCNGAVIAPQFGDVESDEAAVKAIRKHYPGREVVTLDVDALGEVGGGIHCATQQIPA